MTTSFPRENAPRSSLRFVRISAKKGVTPCGVLSNRRLRCLCAVGIAAIAMMPLAIRAAETAGEEAASRSGFVAELTAEEAQLIAQREADSRRITILEANLIHARFIDRCMERLPTGVALEYSGALGTENGGTGLRIIGGVGCPLEWAVHKNVVIFSFWISTRRMKETLAKCSIEGKDIFLNVSFVDEARSVDAKLAELGGRSVREVVSAIEKPPADAPN